MKSVKYFGICGASGYAISKVFIVKDIEYKIPIKNVINVDEEIQQLEEVYEIILDKTNKNVEITRKMQGDENAKILEAHVALLLDFTIKEEIIALIKENNHCTQAIEKVMIKWENKFKQMEDEYFKARAFDIRDVFTKLIKNVLNINDIDLSSIKEEVILVAHDLTPSLTSQLNPAYIKGLVTEIGSATSHTALMAESMKIPAILGLKDITSVVNNNDKIIVYSTPQNCYVVIKPSNEEIEFVNQEIERSQKIEQESKLFIGKRGLTSDEYQIKLEANIGNVNDAKIAFELDADGIGLMRSEFLYMENPKKLPNEEVQFEAYKKVLQLANNKPVIIRTLDIGGDKNISSLNLEKELNPFLGCRAIRISLTNKQLFRTQLRALFRASIYGNLGIMFPFISTVNEFIKAKEFAKSIASELVLDELIKEEDKDRPKIGMMIEIPSTIWMVSTYAEHADFFSVGTNDLVQYMYAVDRVNPKVSHLGDYFDPAFIKCLSELTKNSRDVEIAMCGQMASDPLALPLLVGLDFKILSMSSTKILKTKRNLSLIKKNDAKKLVKRIIKKAWNAKEVKDMIKEHFKDLA